jgi:hypothetical protein
MSLLRLLTTGKTLVGIRDAETRYRVTRQRLLPQFGTAKNPFCACNKPGSAKAAAETVEPSQATGAEGKLPASVPQKVLGGASHFRLTHGLRSRVAAIRDGWAGKLTSLLSTPPRKPARAVFAPPAKLPVQGELSLERVKVVRNDLSDADLAVVPAKQQSAPASVTSALQPSGNVAPTGTWGRVSNLFRAGRM